MNRPQKKHKPKKDDILEDPRFTREQLEEADRKLHEKDAVQGDDRNLIHVDDAFKEADLEDQVWLFWSKYKNTIIGSVVIVFLGVIGVEGYKLYQRNAVKSMQAAFSEADSANTLSDFGQQYAGTPLGGFAQLETADEKYREGDFAQAATLYKAATDSLVDTYLMGRARLGEAMSHYKAGSHDLAKNLLSSMSSDANILTSLRAEAAFNLAIIALGNDDYTTARNYFEQVKSLTPQGPWAAQANALENQIPQLAATGEAGTATN